MRVFLRRFWNKQSLDEVDFKKEFKKNDVTEIMNLIMKVDHKVDAQLGAAHTHCEKWTGIFLLFSLLPRFSLERVSL